MRQVRICIAAAAAIAGCAAATPAQPKPELSPRLGSAHAETATPESSETEPAPEVPTLSSASDALAEAVTALADHADVGHVRMIAALRALADALSLATGAPPEIETLRRSADALGRLPEDSQVGADVVRPGLEDALLVLATLAPALPDQAARYHAAVDAMANAVDAIEPGVSLVAQRPLVVEALRRASEAVTIVAATRVGAAVER